MKQDEVMQRLLTFFREEWQAGDVSAETELLRELITDSLRLVTLALFMEQSFGVRFAPTDMNPDLFHSPASLARFIVEKSP
ncbi:MAG: acyl carrier protein [Magnetococcales bacterium]|nr:acyl carrier protein [Magnetococcales bacterium]